MRQKRRASRGLRGAATGNESDRGNRQCGAKMRNLVQTTHVVSCDENLTIMIALLRRN
jgi:hypothetical protein